MHRFSHDPDTSTASGSLFRLALAVVLLLLPTGSTIAQVPIQFRVWLLDKGVPDGILSPDDPSWPAATAHLTPRALARRARVLPPSEVVTTRDLPVYPPYINEVVATGVDLLQRSRWFNTLLVRGDSAQFAAIGLLPFVEDVEQLGDFSETGNQHRQAKELWRPATVQTAPLPLTSENCLTGFYGRADSQLVRIGADHAHRIGVSGHGVLIGILDAGFDPVGHRSIERAHVVATYDFVNDDATVADEPGQTPSRSHGTLVMSVIAAILPDTLLGVAPDALFALAKTEDVASETPVEEDNFVAGLEWLESLGVDITNTSLGYTTFDSPYYPHGADLTGSTALASRAVNYATRLGVLSIVSAGNEFRGFRLVGVPAEADSAVAVGALDREDRAAPFSSRGTPDTSRIKPDISAPGVRIYGADADDPDGVVAVQGTSLAAPLVTGAAALLYAAAPGLTPWEARSHLLETAGRLADPASAIGAGIVRIDRALHRRALLSGIAGQPSLQVDDDRLAVACWIALDPPAGVDEVVVPSESIRRELRLTNTRTGATVTLSSVGPRTGVHRWFDRRSVRDLDLLSTDTLVAAVEVRPGTVHTSVVPVAARGNSTLCAETPPLRPQIVHQRPNPAAAAAEVDFLLTEPATVTLELYTTTGERVDALLSGLPLPAGFHRHLVNLAAYPAGAYYYLLVVDGTVYSWPVRVVR